MIRIGRRREAPGRRYANAGDTHEPLDTLPADPRALLTQRTVDARAAVDPPLLLMDRGDLRGQSTIRRLARRVSPIAPSKVAGLRRL